MGSVSGISDKFISSVTLSWDDSVGAIDETNEIATKITPIDPIAAATIPIFVRLFI